MGRKKHILTVNSAWLWAGLVLAGGAVPAQNLVRDGGLEAKPPVWQTAVPYGSNVDFVAHPVHAGTRAARLSSFTASAMGGLEQSVPQVPAGLYELSVWATGKGKIRLSGRGGGTRLLRVQTADWALYCLLFEWPAEGSLKVAVEAAGDVVVDDLELKPATAAQQQAWTRQQQALVQFGFIPSGDSAQPAEPLAAGAAASAVTKPVAITRKTVFFDPRYDAAWNRHCDLLAAWFAARGFAVKSAPELVAWMQDEITRGAFGSVVVMGMGLVPGALVTPLDETALLRRYLEAGGRMVWTGDTALYIAQDETGPVYVLGAAGMNNMLGVPCDPKAWNSKAAPKPTESGKHWGLQGSGTCLRGVFRDQVTLALAEDAKLGIASVWLQTVNPAYPLSGFIASVGAVDGRNGAGLEDFYRLALFSGEPVAVPAVTALPPPPPAPLSVVIQSGGKARRAYVRGEKVAVGCQASIGAPGSAGTGYRLALYPQAPELRVYDLAAMGMKAEQAALEAYQRKWPELTPVWSQEFQMAMAVGGGAGASASASVELDTANLAVGDYQVVVEAGGKRAFAPLAICARPRSDRIGFAMRGPQPDNVYRLYRYLDELKQLGLDLQWGHGVSAAQADAVLRNNQTFIAALEGPEGLLELRKGANGEDWPDPWSGGLLGLTGMAGQACRDKAVKVFAEQVGLVAPYPAFSKVCLTNDDFSARGGWDYNPENLREFKAKTGLDAPAPDELKKGKPPYGIERIARPSGVIPDQDPWLLWNEFLCRDVFGGYNDATRRGAETVCPGVLVGQVPGGAQWPLFMLYAGQYPALNIASGKGFNCVMYYAYLGYWCPNPAYLYWAEVARMGNRELPVWTMPDAGGDARHYIRNTAHLLLAGGTKGLAYYIYEWTKPEGRKELGELGAMLQQYGPLLYRLKPAPKEAALLVSFTEACFAPGYALASQYPFMNLLQAHVPVEIVAEEELPTASYQLILLSAVGHLRSSAVAALEQTVARGGMVLLDKDCQVPVRGAKKLDISLGVPSISEFSKLETVAAVRQAVQPWLTPEWDSPEITTLIRPLVSADGAQYVYVVQTDTHEEYLFWRRNCYEPSVFGRSPPETKERIEAFLKAHGMGANLADTVMTVAFPETALPAGGKVIDVYAGKELTTEKSGTAGKLQVRVTTRRFGGTLLAFLPEPPHAVTIRAQPVKAGEKAVFEFTVTGKDDRPLRGSQPLEVTLTDPEGRDCPEISGYCATAAGRLQREFTPAAHYPKGKWTLKCTERFTGKTAAQKWTVQE